MEIFGYLGLLGSVALLIWMAPRCGHCCGNIEFALRHRPAMPSRIHYLTVLRRTIRRFHLRRSFP